MTGKQGSLPTRLLNPYERIIIQNEDSIISIWLYNSVYDKKCNLTWHRACIRLITFTVIVEPRCKIQCIFILLVLWHETPPEWAISCLWKTAKKLSETSVFVPLSGYSYSSMKVPCKLKTVQKVCFLEGKGLFFPKSLFSKGTPLYYTPHKKLVYV